MISLLQVNAASFAQKLTLVKAPLTVEQVLREIKKQTNYNVLVESTHFNTATKINANFVDAPLEKVMETILKGSQMTYVIEQNTIVIKTQEKSFLDRIIERFLAIDVSGKISDESGRPVPGASISVKGTNLRTVSDENGNFSIKNVDENATVVINFIGYQTVELKAAKNLGTIRLKVAIGDLTEVNIVSDGYRTLPKERSAGSFSTVNMDVVANRTTSMNILQSLDGQVPGLVVNNAPQKNQLLIRGLSTIAGAGNFPSQSTTAQPLYVIDGIAVPPTNDYDRLPDIILNLNPQDVESITVLKDAAAASIWGARAANGVIIIQTRSGKFNEKLRISYSGFVNFQGKPELDYIKMLNSRQYVETGIELFNTAHTPWATISAVNGGGIPPLELILYNKERGIITEAQAAAQLEALANQDNRQQIKDLFYRDAMLNNNTLSLTGGSDKYAFYASTSYTKTISSTPGEKNDTYKINFRQDIKPLSFLSLYLITDISNTKTSGKRPYSVDYMSAPYVMYRDANGNNLNIPHLTGQYQENLRDMEARARVSLAYSPLDEFENGYTKSDALMARLNGGFKLNFTKNLRFDGTYGYTKGKNKITDYETLQSFTVRKEIAQFAVAASPTVVPKYYIPSNGGRLTTVNGDQHKWDIRNQLVYDQTFGKHEINAVLGQEAQENFNTSTSNRVRGFDDVLLTQGSVDYATIAGLIQNTVWPNFSTIGSLLANDTFSTNESTLRFTSYYANLGYTFNSKYTLNLSWRNDQSNLFGKSKSAQNKPTWSAGVRWNASNEDFMKQISWINRLALRATYGILGNSPNAGVAASNDIIQATSSPFFQSGIGMRIATPANPNLSWERTSMLNLGLDFGVLRDRLSASIDFYQKKTTDLIGVIFPNSLTGFASLVGNQGDLKNTGIEFNINSTNVRSNNFNWSTNWIFAYNKNKLVKVNRNAPIATAADQVQAGAVEGYPLFTVFAYQYAGLNNLGATKIRLADGTETAAITGAKPEDVVYMGTAQPIWNGGLTNNFQYKQFRLSVNMVYNMGHVMRRDRYLSINRPMMSNVEVAYLDRWKKPGDEANTNIPGVVASTTSTNYSYFTFADENVVDASFLKLRDVTLFYNLPTTWVKKIRAQNVSLRAQLSNVMLWTANKYNLDPEFSGLAVRTNQNTISLGANISF